MDLATQIATEIARSICRTTPESIAELAAIVRSFLPDQVPELEIDRKLYNGCKMSANAKLERRIVWNLMRELGALGWIPAIVHWDEKTPVTDAKSAMEWIFNLDDCWVTFLNHANFEASVRFVLGNGRDVISDYTWAESGPKASFSKTCEDFNPEAYE